MKKGRLLLVAIALAITSGIFVAIVIKNKSYATLDGFSAGNIISDYVMSDYSSMTESQIQSFLKSKNSCNDSDFSKIHKIDGAVGYYYGTNGTYTYNIRYGHFVCMADDTFDGETAAHIIWQAAQDYKINPQVIIVLLQKEQGLITDTYPNNVQYRSATGYACPDTAACDSQFYGIKNQIRKAASLFRNVLDGGWTNYPVGANYIQYNPSASCGGSVVTIENRATSALYRYTPYQPNSAALAAGWGTATCGAYGNRNFYNYFTSWFGTTSGPNYAWQLKSAKLYYDSGLTQEVANNDGTYSLKPGQVAYVKVIASNIGRSTWTKSATRLGTQSPQDHTSPFANSTWLGGGRTGGYSESGDIAPGGTATFTYSITAPQLSDEYVENFAVVIDGVAWTTPVIGAYRVSVTSAENTELLGKNFTLKPGASLTPGQNIISTEGHSALHMSFSGSLELWVNYKKVWSTNTDGSGANRFINQGDGNLVLYKDNTPIWASNTPTPGVSGDLILQSDGNAVLYKSGAPVWASNTSTYDQYGLTNSSLSTGGVLYPGQSLSTPNRYYRLVAQTDGNIVLYTPTRAIWASNTYKQLYDRIVVQGDGNIVAYDGNNHPVWSTNTFMSGGSTLRMQGDGNVVFYSADRAVWASNTFMVR